MASALLRFHKILVAAALVLAALCVAWGALHWIARREPGAWMVFAVGLVAGVAGGLYFRKLRKNPPIK